VSGIETWDFDEIRPRVNNEFGLGYVLPSQALTVRRSVMRSEVAVPDHVHPYDQVVIVFDGEVTIASEGNVFPLSKGMLLRIAAGTVHSAVFNAGCDVMELGLGVDRDPASVH
jgi:quercetin dioxygenase-like cupin family protein